MRPVPPADGFTSIHYAVGLMIRLEHVYKTYGSVNAVNGVSLTITPGQVVGLLGPNGAGKSTTVRMIAGVVPPTAGRITVDDLDTVRHSRKVRRRLGYLPESTPLYPEMKVRDYLAYRASLYGIGGSKRTRAVDYAMQRCFLADVRTRRIGQLSKGYKQRTGLAAALVHDPRVLILDEPTSGLDPAQVVENRKLIRSLAGERTMIVVSHMLAEVERTCDRIIILARGSVQADGPPAELLATAGGPNLRRYIVELRGGPNELRRLFHSLPGSLPVELKELPDGWRRCVVAFGRTHDGETIANPQEAIGRACAGAGMLIRELRSESTSLEEIYLRLIERAQSGAGRGAAA